MQQRCLVVEDLPPSSPSSIPSSGSQHQFYSYKQNRKLIVHAMGSFSRTKRLLGAIEIFGRKENKKYKRTCWWICVYQSSAWNNSVVPHCTAHKTQASYQACEAPCHLVRPYQASCYCDSLYHYAPVYSLP